MNGRTRGLAALRGEPTDRVPVLLHNFLMAARENGIPQSRFRRDAAGQRVARNDYMGRINMTLDTDRSVKVLR